MDRTLHDDVALAVLPALITAECQRVGGPRFREAVAKALDIADSFVLQRQAYEPADGHVLASAMPPTFMTHTACVDGLRHHRWGDGGVCLRAGCHARASRWYMNRMVNKKARQARQRLARVG